jgi:hypothetical protein
MLLSIGRAVGYVFPNHYGVGIFAGHLMLSLEGAPGTERPGWVSWPFRPWLGWMPFWRPDVLRMIGIPLWMPAAGLGTCCAYALRRAAHAGPGDARACTGCGYPFDGLPTGAACPECGRPQSDTADPGRPR